MRVSCQIGNEKVSFQVEKKGLTASVSKVEAVGKNESKSDILPTEIKFKASQIKFNGKGVNELTFSQVQTLAMGVNGFSVKNGQLNVQSGSAAEYQFRPIQRIF
ncbi:hypothetical protein COB21_03145 [Candidatus Aerophobetes bacterium]|uniref:Uncharacterized protein n=1 Tax=Aerophobetes bacterium TaxID=2030807 RepID=A0A2A4X5P7_UNCAE|nr:MAG: hypothetical protein COB21_03145 [Candidatus Aerophobetes bacterium]